MLRIFIIIEIGVYLYECLAAFLGSENVQGMGGGRESLKFSR